MTCKSTDDGPAFACDAMLGGLARWLRAAGYDAVWRYGIEDDELVALAAREARWLLTSDLGIFERRVITRGELPSLYIPPGTNTTEQLGFVMNKLGLAIRESRCMACGGGLAHVPKTSVREVVPEKSFRRHEDFTRCGRCGKVFWEGTHRGRICRRLGDALNVVPPRDAWVPGR